MFKRYITMVVLLAAVMTALGNVIDSDLAKNIPATEWFDSVPTNIYQAEGMTAWHYNAARQLDHIIKSDGTIISNVYDFAGRLVATWAEKNGAADEISYTYDGAGRLGSISRAGSSIQYGYDAFLLTSEITPHGTMSFGYDDDFRVTSVTVNDTFSVSYTYDDDGLLTQAGDISLIRDSASGFLTGTAIGNITDQRTYNGFGEVANYTANVSGNPVYSVAYSYDALGRITNQAETISSETTVNKSYVYDNRGRLTQVTTNGAISESYTYDANGNRISSIVGAVPRTAIFDNQDRMLSYGDMTFAYSLNGEQTNRTANGQVTSLSYDLFGQLSSVSLPEGRTISYDLDALGRIIAKRVNGAVVKGWIYKDGLKPVAETDGAGNVISVFVYGSSALVPDYMIRYGATYRIIRDHVGSIRLVVDVNSGAIAQRLDYDSFGNVLSDTNPGFQPFGFQSGLYDNDTGFVQFGARWYDSVTGRWLSKDSLLLAAGWNVYAFCANNPVNFTDPLGLCESGNFFTEGYENINRNLLTWYYHGNYGGANNPREIGRLFKLQVPIDALDRQGYLPHDWRYWDARNSPVVNLSEQLLRQGAADLMLAGRLWSQSWRYSSEDSLTGLHGQIHGTLASYWFPIQGIAQVEAGAIMWIERIVSGAVAAYNAIFGE